MQDRAKNWNEVASDTEEPFVPSVPNADAELPEDWEEWRAFQALGFKAMRNNLAKRRKKKP